VQAATKRISSGLLAELHGSLAAVSLSWLIPSAAGWLSQSSAAPSARESRSNRRRPAESPADRQHLGMGAADHRQLPAWIEPLHLEPSVIQQQV